MQDTVETFAPRLIAEWRQQARPLFLVDEVRDGELVSFILLVINSQLATRFADNASSLRDLMQPADRDAYIKGSNLYGRRRHKKHDGLRLHVRDVIGRCSVVRFTTCSEVLRRYEKTAPGGIRPTTAAPMAPIRGRELVPFMTMMKIAANAHGLGPVQVDVLLDRSAQLGLDHSQLGQPKHHYWIIGPGELNEQADGTPATYHCPSRFLFVAPPKPSLFRDLLLLPDALAYVVWRRGDLDAARTKVAAGQDFVLDIDNGATLASPLAW